ncbi:hypothetical protein BUALT_Bualt09G0018700 [Buddleja alternifolia]|uniref:CREG-like beta-barrel domain-containing protein n=1 Tax=Buddleja alternifolia TaxID=168488 RepID=A0AAV6X6E3_9LAMI|nr:hypothetical protein BUALT_Bualt09G0018700 [Buddleja alternifolia]
MKTIKETILHNFIFAPIIFSLIISQVSSQSSPSPARPPPEDAPVFARWLVKQGLWGVLNTLDSARSPFGNVMSYSDGGTGTPYFYLSTLDPTAVFGSINPRASFTLSEYELGYSCNGKDPQSPLCAKITFSGRLKLLAPNSKEGSVARGALFEKHPQFRGFPLQNGTFNVFKLVIKSIFLVNLAAPQRNLTVEEYYLAKST